MLKKESIKLRKGYQALRHMSFIIAESKVIRNLVSKKLYQIVIIASFKKKTKLPTQHHHEIYLFGW